MQVRWLMTWFCSFFFLLRGETHFIDDMFIFKNNSRFLDENLSHNLTPSRRPQGDDDTNMGGAPAALGSNVYSWDSDTSEEETAVNYTQVNFPTKAGHAGTRKDSSSSERDEANYSEVKVWMRTRLRDALLLSSRPAGQTTAASLLLRRYKWHNGFSLTVF